ncbi:hypothetical protein SCHPADRAFT_935136 [Schizopora paradoxa]|uniref:Uncharacterized protein n=1 Tax=Schizopora paradoxa TaxID=27342 RepID=A0A0H2SRD7_9AGAM|nr:hypothetical protein SCHPADRAFT_935136 [Schizopora paradoxa]
MSASLESRKEKKKDKKEKKEKRKEKETGYQKANDPVEEEGRNTTCRPPPGSVLLLDTIDSETFDYDALKEDDDLELWIIRVPDGISPKHLNNQQIPVPSSSSTQQIGTLSRKHATYDIWSVCPQTIHNDGQPPAPAGGDETLGLTCLVPRKKKDSKLYMAPKPVVHHLVLSGQPALPTPPTSPPEPYRRYSHPHSVLKHRFLPVGTVVTTTAEGMDLDTDDTVAQRAQLAKMAAQNISANLQTSKEDKALKHKKRKGDSTSEVTKKSKKVKT